MPAAELPDPALPAEPPAAAPCWHVRLLGAVVAEGAGRRIVRWPSRATAALLARLALWPGRRHPREELVEHLWPGVALGVGRNRLRQALSALRAELGDAGAADPVIVADRHAIGAAPGRLGCDVHDFERALRSGDVERARMLLAGDLLPGFYDDWVLDERRRIAALAERLDAPAPAAAAVALHPLPAYRTRAFGLEPAAARLRALVRAQRLVTVCAPGGAGKTRLAVETARALQAGAPAAPQAGPGGAAFDRVVFVSLAERRDAAGVADAVAAALQVAGAEPLERIVVALGGQRALLLLDNFEQLAGHAGSVVAVLLARLAHLHVLVTSRQRLALDGEYLFELGGLPVADGDADAIRASPAVALFVDRAGAVNPGGPAAWSADELHAVRELVRRLDGLPLAIELAASRSRTQPPLELLRRLSSATGSAWLDLLARPGDDGGRHASMRRVVGWSWAQLDASQQAMLAAVAAFSAPAAAPALAAVSGVGEDRAWALLESLHDASLVHGVRDGDDGLRYGLLQPVREFVAEQVAPERAAQLRQRACRWLIDRVTALQHRGSAALEAELPHIDGAIVAARDDGRARDAAELAAASSRWWLLDTHEAPPASTVRALQQVLPQLTDDTLRCEVALLLAFALGLAGAAAEAEPLTESALGWAVDARQRSLAHTRAAWVAMLLGRWHDRHDRALDAAVALARSAGSQPAQALALRMQMLACVNLRQDYAAGEARARQAQQLWEQVGDRRNAIRSLLDRATCWAWQGRNEEAAAAMAECERAAAAAGDGVGAQMAAWLLGRVFIRLRRWADAEQALRRCLLGGWQRNRLLSMLYALLHLPDAWVALDRAEDAARLQGFAAAHWQRSFGAINRIEQREMRRTRRLAAHRLGAARAEALRLEGLGMTLAEAVATGLGVPVNQGGAPRHADRAG